ncbi:MAG: hypothetical protein HRT68_01255, partial [Flavobacteriaceae bacterium]|nr:hypothetical protein [Flavobacteriaceae bacterium]
MTNNSTIKVGNGGAGIVGFVQFMFNKFNEVTGSNYTFKWVTSDTEETLTGLAKGTLDIGWPYAIDRVCKDYAKHTDSYTEPKYIFRDHFVLVGPNKNPAKLPSSSDDHPHVSNDDVIAMFKTISEGKNGTVFLTRNDMSATNVLEREIFKMAIGRYPDPDTDSWYLPLTGSDHYPDTT